MSQDTISESIFQRIKKAKEQQIEELDLSHERLTQIPDKVFELTHLKKLYLSNNNIQQIPKEISQLRNLEHLDLIENDRLINLTDEIYQRIVRQLNLNFLGLDWNINNSIPDWFEHIPQLGLHIVDGRPSVHSAIRRIPDEIVNLNNLKTLKLWFYCSESLPSMFERLEKLELKLYATRLNTTILESIIRLTNLTSFEISFDSHITSIPESIGDLIKLTTLNLNSQSLVRLPDSIGNLINLTTLYLSYNRLSSLPESISNIINLKYLYLNSNQLLNLPESISNLTNLMRLDLRNNQLPDLPKSTSNFVNLKLLFLVSNQLSKIP